jgi:serine/threonine protein kinase
MIANKYDLISKIGAGAFGAIYKGQNIRTGEPVAIKVEPLKHETNLLKNEARIYQYLKGGTGIPQVKWFGVDDTNNYMVINLLGESLQHNINTYGTFSLLNSISIGIQMIERIQYVHECGLIHRDVKPDNFLFGLNEQRERLYIIDFGFCKKCNNPQTTTPTTTPTTAPQKKMTSILGTPNYISISVHDYIEPNKHDDLESILYTIMYLYYGRLPWDTPGITNTEIRNMKQVLLYGAGTATTIPKIFTQFAYILSTYREKSNEPNYKSLLELLNMFTNAK